MNWLLIGVGVIFLIGMVIGYVRGFVKIIVSFGVTVATVSYTHLQNCQRGSCRWRFGVY